MPDRGNRFGCLATMAISLGKRQGLQHPNQYLSKVGVPIVAGFEDQGNVGLVPDGTDDLAQLRAPVPWDHDGPSRGLNTTDRFRHGFTWIRLKRSCRGPCRCEVSTSYLPRGRGGLGSDPLYTVWEASADAKRAIIVDNRDARGGEIQIARQLNNRRRRPVHVVPFHSAYEEVDDTYCETITFVQYRADKGLGSHIAWVVRELEVQRSLDVVAKRGRRESVPGVGEPCT